jgi:ElaB/YqjD/DUF883 family membrane-anchored ribosome-binding protein
MSNALRTEYGTKQPGPGYRMNPTEASQSGVMETVTDKAKELASGVSEFAGQAKDTVQDLASSAMHQVEYGYDTFTRFIRRYPVPALLVAFGVGIVTGMALGASSHARYRA